MDLFDDFSAVPAHRPTWAEIKLENLLFNLEQIKKAVGPEARIMGVVKADAYGHGDRWCAREMEECGVNWFGVSNLDEALSLREGLLFWTRPLPCARRALTAAISLFWATPAPTRFQSWWNGM